MENWGTIKLDSSRKNRSCTDQIASQRLIVEQSIEWGTPLLNNFIDYLKAFGRIDWETPWKPMRRYGIPAKIENFTKSSNCHVLHEGQFSDLFKWGQEYGRDGFFHLFSLSLLSIGFCEKQTKRKRNGMQRNSWHQCSDLNFVDYLAPLSHTQHQMRTKTEDLNSVSRNIGIRIHTGKSQIMKIGKTSTAPITCGNTPL